MLKQRYNCPAVALTLLISISTVWPVNSFASVLDRFMPESLEQTSYDATAPHRWFPRDDNDVGVSATRDAQKESSWNCDYGGWSCIYFGEDDDHEYEYDDWMEDEDAWTEPTDCLEEGASDAMVELGGKRTSNASRYSIVDFASVGATELRVKRTRDLTLIDLKRVGPSGLGEGWLTNFDKWVTYKWNSPTQLVIRLYRADGSRKLMNVVVKNRAGFDKFSLEKHKLEIRLNSTGSVRLLTLQTRSGRIEEYDASGRLVRARDASKTLEYAYSAQTGFLQTVSSRDRTMLDFSWTTVGREIRANEILVVSYGLFGQSRDIAHVSVGNTPTYWLPAAIKNIAATAHANLLPLNPLNDNRKITFGCTRAMNITGGQTIYDRTGLGHSYVCINNVAVTGQSDFVCSGYSSGRMTGAADGDSFSQSSRSVMGGTTCFDSCAARKLASANPGAYSVTRNNCYDFTKGLLDACRSECN